MFLFTDKCVVLLLITTGLLGVIDSVRGDAVIRKCFKEGETAEQCGPGADACKVKAAGGEDGKTLERKCGADGDTWMLTNPEGFCVCQKDDCNLSEETCKKAFQEHKNPPTTPKTTGPPKASGALGRKSYQLKDLYIVPGILALAQVFYSK